jgi:hypothetical protein
LPLALGNRLAEALEFGLDLGLGQLPDRDRDGAGFEQVGRPDSHARGDAQPFQHPGGAVGDRSRLAS